MYGQWRVSRGTYDRSGDPNYQQYRARGGLRLGGRRRRRRRRRRRSLSSSSPYLLLANTHKYDPPSASSTTSLTFTSKPILRTMSTLPCTPHPLHNIAPPFPFPFSVPSSPNQSPSTDPISSSAPQFTKIQPPGLNHDAIDAISSGCSARGRWIMLYVAITASKELGGKERSDMSDSSRVSESGM